jgi:hypothetical protein
MNIPYQDDYLFASRRLADALEGCKALPFTDSLPSDHAPTVAGTGEARGSRVGYLVVLLGAALFVASCFVPFYRFEGPAQRAFSLYEQQTSGGIDGGSLGSLLYLFAGVAIATSIAVVGVARSDLHPRVPSLLLGAVAAWSLPWIGVMLSWTSFGISLEVGYWVQAVSIGVVIVGTIVVMASGRAKAYEQNAT